MTNEQTDWRALCAELLKALSEWALGQGSNVDAPLIIRARAALAQPEPEKLPPGYIDPEHEGQDLKLLETFYKACRSEGGTADEIHLRGLKAVLALAQPRPEGVTDEQWDAIKDRLWDKYETVGYQGERFMSNDDFDAALDVARQELASTALAQPEPEGPTASDVTELFYRHMGEGSEIGFENAIAEALTRWGRPTIKPVPVAERLPEPGRKVLAHYLNALGKPRTIIAEWVPAKTREDSPEGDLGEYDDETDLFYWPEGWYEQIENWDDFTALFVDEGEITHWQPLPRGPHHALPVPGAEVNHG
jgi:hypothetical protein